MTYVYTVNSIGLNNIVYFASKRAALCYAVRHNIRCSDGKIRLVRCRSDIAKYVRDDLNQIKKEYPISYTNQAVSEEMMEQGMR